MVANKKKAKKAPAKKVPAKKASARRAPEPTPEATESGETQAIAQDLIGLAMEVNDVMGLVPAFEYNEESGTMQIAVVDTDPKTGEEIVTDSYQELEEEDLKGKLVAVGGILELGDIYQEYAKEGASVLSDGALEALKSLGVTIPEPPAAAGKGKAKGKKPAVKKVPKEGSAPKAQVEKDEFGFRLDTIKHTVAEAVQKAGKKGITIAELKALPWNTRKNDYKSYWMEMVASGFATFDKDAKRIIIS